ncbi:MAG: T9SS type A sorting domain-containing protein [Saprospiraceae bacterium]|nr:T9SS type A sorting domain-containing protein [Candidatus Defluviibacterium haderslevense]
MESRRFTSQVISNLCPGNYTVTVTQNGCSSTSSALILEPEIYCCDSILLKTGSDSCCSGITSRCEVTSVNVSITNGVISSANWNCGVLPNGYIGQSNFTFTPGLACPMDLEVCFNPINANPVVVAYMVFAEGCVCTITDTKKCPCAMISGELWHDVNNDGIHDSGESPLYPYDVHLVDLSGNPIMSTTTTSPSGAYSFSCMPPGQYYVQFDPPAGYEPSPGNATGSSPNTDSDINLGNGTYNTDPINVSNGDTINNLDAGLFYCCDFVLIEDTNDSCCSRITSLCAVDSINVNVQNGTISLISWNCAPRLNNYYATGLSNFTLGIPSGCPLSFGVCVDPIYTNPYAPVIITYTVYSSSGAVCTKYDTLYCPCAVITGEAWYDSNGDGIYQQIENGINGMLIQLVDAMTGKTVSTMETITRPGTSSDDGYYEFPCVKPGMYYIRFDSLAGFTTSTPFQGGKAETDSDITGTYGPYTTYKITVMNGDTINNIDGGYKDSTSVNIGHLTIAGLIITETTTAMLPSRVNLATANNSNYKTEWSHYSGNYAFSDLTAGQDYRISVENNESPLQGVSTRDIVLIQKHILGIKYLDSPYKIIAADVNSSQSITASDLAEIRKLILGVIETFPKNKSWRFVPMNYVFKNPAYPFPFEENILHSKIENNKMNTDFYAIKIGDVSGNALGIVNTTTRSIKNVQLIFEKTSYKKNEEISVPIRISEGDMLSGIQIALQCSDVLEFVTIEKGSLNINQENYRFNRGQLLISYNEARGFDVGKKDIFTLRFKAKTDLNIDNKIRSSNLLENEAYDLTDQVVPLEVISSVENIKTTSGVYKFYLAKPNPFKQETMIEFELPNEEAIIFTVYNPEGKLVWSKEKIYISGNNQMSISKEDLGHSGLYYLHIQSKEFCKTQRILMLD